MAPTFRHGKLTRIFVNQVPLHQILNDASVKQSVDTSECTVYGDVDRRYLAGQRDSSVTYSGMADFNKTTGAGVPKEYDKTVLEPMFASSTVAAVNTYCPGGDTIGNAARLFQGTLQKLDIASPVSGVVAVDAEMQTDGTMVYGYVLKSSTGAVTAATTYATVDAQHRSSTSSNGSGSTKGGVIHVHNLSWATTGAVTLKVQHSSAGASWADLGAAITVNSTRRYSRQILAGQVKRYLKCVVTSKTGGNQTPVVAAGRIL